MLLSGLRYSLWGESLPFCHLFLVTTGAQRQMDPTPEVAHGSTRCAETETPALDVLPRRGHGLLALCRALPEEGIIAAAAFCPLMLLLRGTSSNWHPFKGALLRRRSRGEKLPGPPPGRTQSFSGGLSLKGISILPTSQISFGWLRPHQHLWEAGMPFAQRSITRHAIWSSARPVSWSDFASQPKLFTCNLASLGRAEWLLSS